jgi:hypothetical protein
MKNAIAKSFGRSQEELAFLLSDQRRISSQSELDAMMGKEDEAAEEGFELLLENLTQTKNAYDKVEDTVGKLNTKMYVETSENAYKASKNFSLMNTELQNNTNLLGTSRGKFTELNNAYLKSLEKLPQGKDARNIGIKEFTKSVVASAEDLGKEAIAILTQAENVQKKYASVSQNAKNELNEISKTRQEIAQIEEETIKREKSQSGLAGQFNASTNVEEGAIIVNVDQAGNTTTTVDQSKVKTYIEGKT